MFRCAKMKRYKNAKDCFSGESLGALIVVIFLLFFGIRNIKNFGKPFCDFFEAKINFQELTKETQNAYLSNFSAKNIFVDLNGLFVRIIGKHVSNKAILLDNGMLTQNFPEVDLQDKAERTICFSNELEKRGVKLIYVQVPTKMDLNNEMFGNIHSNNMVSFGNKNADELVDLLLQGGIEVL